jgi:GNAT superfamily N-acetyltransferase
MTEPSGIEIRPAAAGELSAAARVYLLAEDELLGRLSGRAPRAGTADGAAVEATAAYDLAVAAGDGPERVLVALAGREVVGVAAWRVWDHWWFLGYFFVLPAFQGRAIGRTLLERAHAGGVAAGCTLFSLFASDDPRALTRYLALGLQPQPPVLDLRVMADRFRPPSASHDDGLTALVFAAESLEAATLGTLGDLDRVTRGARRQGDLQRWLAEGASGALLTDWDSGTPAGYFLVSAPPLGKPGRGRIGPVVALDVERFPAILARALAAAAPLVRPDLEWRVTVPGQNRAAIAPLFAAGFQPRALEAYLATAPIGRWDRYVLRDEDDV